MKKITHTSAASVFPRIAQAVVLLIIAASISTACSSEAPERRQSNKIERNAVKAGNKAYHQRNFGKAIQYYDEALESNATSEKARFNHALASLVFSQSDSTARAQADQTLRDLAENAEDPEVAENAIYTMANFSNYIGDELKQQAQGDQDQNMAQQLNQKSTEYYKQAISGYEELLRRKPGDLKVTQNLRITQLKLPPEDNNNNQQNQDQNQDQQNQDNEQQQQQQQQPQQEQQQQQQPQADALNALEKREAQTRKKQKQPAAARAQSEKPW